MPVPAQYRGRYAYHFCHLENLPSVLQHGLLCCHLQQDRRIRHRSIAEQSIQHRRSTMPVTCAPGGVVHDYVPFYFCKRSSMLMAVVRAKNVDQQELIYFAVPIEIVERDDVVFTSASANTDPPPRFYSDPADLARLNWQAIDSLKWSMPSDAEKQARQAEVLIHRHLPVDRISHIIVWNDHFRDQVLRRYREAGLPAPTVQFSGRHYLTKYPQAPNESLVTGPGFTLARYDASYRGLADHIGQAAAPRFKNLFRLRDRLRDNPASVPLVGELFGLKSDNVMHKEDVGQHTQRVVQHLLAVAKYRALNDTDKLLCEIAAYFHDVGKGPKERWKDNGYRQKADLDHPVTGAEAVAQYLRDNVGTMRPRSARVLVMLVCYHDLVGDIIGRGRDRDQLLDVVTDSRDMDMLIALAKADVTAVNAGWWDEAAVAALRSWVVTELDKRAGGAAGDDE